MNEKIRRFEVVKNDVHRIGRFTIVELTDDKGNQSVGVARCSDLDKDFNDVGADVARGRAMRALFMKRRNRRIQNHYMG